MSSFTEKELSVDNADPSELYLFKYNNQEYGFTSADNSIVANGVVYTATHIYRGDSLVLNDSGSSVETCNITVSRTNPVALLYQGAPPELSTVSVTVYRRYDNDTEMITILYGTISQVSFKGSEAELLITIESILSRNIPNGKLSYYCQNCIYDNKCKLDANNFVAYAYVPGGLLHVDNTLTTIHNIQFTGSLESYPDHYFDGGYAVIGTSKRSIVSHVGTMLQISYPINLSDRTVTTFKVYPGCSSIFSICGDRFHNTDHFSGVPYVQPYNAYTHPVSADHAYWINGNVIIRDTDGNVYS